VRLVTYLYIREDVRTLYGFATVEEREIFTRLLTVGGVGPRSALAALSLLSAEQLAATIAAEDAQALARIPGIGARTATRIVVELRGKLPTVEVPIAGSAPTDVAAGAQADVVAALRGMGFTPSEIATRLAALPRDETLSAEEALRLALRQSEPRAGG
jgi:Holliday junction DNA helicase RuvA